MNPTKITKETMLETIDKAIAHNTSAKDNIEEDDVMEAIAQMTETGALLKVLRNIIKDSGGLT